MTKKVKNLFLLNNFQKLFFSVCGWEHHQLLRCVKSWKWFENFPKLRYRSRPMASSFPSIFKKWKKIILTTGAFLPHVLHLVKSVVWLVGHFLTLKSFQHHFIENLPWNAAQLVKFPETKGIWVFFEELDAFCFWKTSLTFFKIAHDDEFAVESVSSIFIS